MSRHATIFGATGLVGSHLARRLAAEGWSVCVVQRGAELEATRQNLGHAFYCIGLTADFRSRPHDTLDAHVKLLNEVLRRAHFTAFVYCSSTRVYARAECTDEMAPLPICPAAPDDLYNISKLMGESVCLASGKRGVRIARLSNVFGADMSSVTFLASVLAEVAHTGAITLRTALTSDKDYVAVDDVSAALEAIAVRGTDPIVNVASGRPTSHGQIIERLARLTSLRVEVAPDAPVVTFPRITTARLDRLLPGGRADVLDSLETLLRQARAPQPLS